MTKLGYLLARHGVRRLREKMDPGRVNGAVFLGLDGVVIKSSWRRGRRELRRRDRGRLRHGSSRSARQNPRNDRADQRAPARARVAASKSCLARNSRHGLSIFVPSCAASAPLCPNASSPTPNSRRWSTLRTNGSGSAPASSSAISPATARRHRRWARAPRGRRCRAGLTAGGHRSDHRRDLDARLHLSRRRDADPGRSRHHARRRLRSAGGLLGLRVRRDDGRQIPRLGLAQARVGDRRGDLFAAARLGRPHDLRAVRRRRRRDRARSGRERRRGRFARRRSRASCAPTDATAPSSMSTAAPRRPRRSATCAWRARKCSSTPSAW